MASVDLFGRTTDDDYYTPGERIGTASPPASPSAPSTTDVRHQLESVSRGVPVSDQDVSDAIARAQGYTGYTLDRSIQDFADQYARRAAPKPGANVNVPGSGVPGVSYPGAQFTDPYTKLYEDVLKNQMASLQGQNAQFQQLMDFLNSQFKTLSTSNGYTPDELAVLNTQAFEPIEAQRKAQQQRELERTSRAGYLPTSGLTMERQGDIDRIFNQARTAAGRDVAINSLNERTNRLNQALNLAQLAVNIPDARNAQAVNYANQLYNLPRTALSDAMGVINASSPQSAISPFVSLLGQQATSQYQQQVLAQQNQSALWQALGQLFGQVFG